MLANICLIGSELRPSTCGQLFYLSTKQRWQQFWYKTANYIDFSALLWTKLLLLCAKVRNMYFPGIWNCFDTSLQAHVAYILIKECCSGGKKSRCLPRIGKRRELALAYPSLSFFHVGAFTSSLKLWVARQDRHYNNTVCYYGLPHRLSRKNDYF